MDNKMRVYRRGRDKVAMWLLSLIVLLASSPAMVMANNVDVSSAQKPVSAPPPAMPPKVNRGSRTVTIFKPKLSLSKNPSDLDLTTARVFSEPLIPMEGKLSMAENRSLATALYAFKAKKSSADLVDFKQFIAKYPKSRWVPSLQLNLGLLSYDNGRISQALTYFQSAYDGSKNAESQEQKSVAESAIANLVLLEARLGKMSELESNLALGQAWHAWLIRGEGQGGT